MGELVAASHIAVEELWGALFGGDGTPRTKGTRRTKRTESRSEEPGTGVVAAIDLLLSVATTQLAEANALWRLIQDELKVGMPSDEAREFLLWGAKVIGPWQPLCWRFKQTFDRLDAGVREKDEPFAAAVAQVDKTVQALRRAVDLLTGRRPNVDEERLAAGRDAIATGRFTRAEEL